MTTSLVRKLQITDPSLYRRAYGLFVVICDNSKRRGHGRPVQVMQVEGVVFRESRHVHLDTQELRDKEGRLLNDFRSFEQMIDTLEQWGKVSVVWEEDRED